jgi:hypothetical protein
VRQETRLPDGSLHFCALAGNHLHEAVQSPDGRVEATSRQGERVRHGASVKDGQVHFLPVRSLAECLREEGLFSGLFSCAASQFNTPVSFALEAGRAELSSDLKGAIETAREQTLEESRLPKSLLAPPTGNTVGLSARSVVLAGVSLRTAGRCQG